ncbi:OX-2 membrane glycoprotein-like isoform X2 [Polyodon spathula]|uniref:OX-2 membrane glycoprotein-like isoform X2 n=1 Tax=Polyodon spathula TaxID=7913 RepID=UPI001B7E7F9B|nr:OX-2 membrane glycoprotein-like isoform X2 [Polyodon spathula]
MMQLRKMCLHILGMLVMGTVYGTVSAELVRTQRVVTATLGENVTLRCELSKSKDVLQVTWQKTKGQSFENIATYNKRFGATITDAFRDRMTVIQVRKDVSCITIQGVKEADETCYNCLFNAYPDGAIIGTTCLSVYEIHEPHFEVESISKPESGHEEVKSITCSVTGKPAPSISWNATEDVFVNQEQYSVVNPNGTTTLICKATVLPSRISNKEVVVNCIVTHPAITSEKKISRVISEAPTIESYLEKKKSKPLKNAVTIGLPIGLLLLLLLLLLLSVLGVVEIFKFGRKKNGKNAESPQKRFPKDNESGSVIEINDPLRTPLKNISLNTDQPLASPLRNRTPLKNKNLSKSLLSDQSPALKNTTPEKKEAKSKRAIRY